MSDAQTILTMIETADPGYGPKLREIDARVWAYLSLNEDFKISFDGSAVYYRHNSWSAESRTVLHHSFQHPEYTRSRDALKAIRPEGWSIESAYRHGYGHDCAYGKLKAPRLRTEELAELHAIIQAIAYERQAQP